LFIPPLVSHQNGVYRQELTRKAMIQQEQQISGENGGSKRPFYLLIIKAGR